MIPGGSRAQIIPYTKRRLLVAVALWGACLFSCGCVRRYATVIATSTPPLATVAISCPESPEGPTPAYIHEEARFVVLFPEKRTYTLVFDHPECAHLTIRVRVTNWAKSKEEMAYHVTSAAGHLTCEKPISISTSPNMMGDSISPRPQKP